MKKDVEGFGDDDDVVLVWYDQIKNENELKLLKLVGCKTGGEWTSPTKFTCCFLAAWPELKDVDD